MRSRNLKPGFFKNEELAECEPLARILYEGLWCCADRDGKLEDRPKRLRAEILPYDTCDIENLLRQLAEKKFIVRYEVDGHKYIKIPTFLDHQNPHKREIESKIPEPSTDLGTDKAKPRHGQGTAEAMSSPADSLLLNPSSLIPESTSSKKPKLKTPEISEPLAGFLREKILSNNPKVRISNFAAWSKDIDLMLNNDGRPADEVKRVIEWCQTDSFWMTNILSAGKLRQQYDQLFMKMKSGNSRASPPAPKDHSRNEQETDWNQFEEKMNNGSP